VGVFDGESVLADADLDGAVTARCREPLDGLAEAGPR
jgi:hypothetical protein